MTMAKGAGLSWAENQTRSLRSNQNTSGTGRAHGSAISISTSGTLLGIGAMSCGGVPKIVARSAAESASPVAGPGAGGGATLCAAGSGSAPRANAVPNSMAASVNFKIIQFIPFKMQPVYQ